MRMGKSARHSQHAAEADQAAEDVDDAATDTARTLEEQRQADLRRHLEEAVFEGESFLVSRQDGELEVEPAPGASRIRRADEELYGVLLSIEQCLADAGRIWRWLVRIGVLTAVIALELGWIERIGQVNAARLRSWWLYLLLAVCGFVVNILITEAATHRVYARRRDELHEAIEKSGLNRYRVLSLIETDGTLTHVARLLKKDNRQTARF
jgi:hypothetical protein